MKIIEFLLDLLGWLQIVAGTTLAGALIGGAVYYFDHSAGLTAGIILMSIGFVAGAIWATRIWIKHGTVQWLSRTRRIS